MAKKKFIKTILDMGDAARMRRAADQGFDVDNVLYHGTRADVDALNPGDVGVHLGTRDAADVRLSDTEAARQGVSNYRTRGSDYGEGANIMPLMTSTNNPLRMSDVGEWRDPVEVLGGIRESAIDPKLRRKAWYSRKLPPQKLCKTDRHIFWMLHLGTK